MKKTTTTAIVAGTFLVALSTIASAQQPAAWKEPTAPFRITDNIYYVGTKGLASYLIASGDEAILLDGTLDENVPAIEANIRALGFELADVKIIINSHAHFDHAAGIARLKQATGAQVAATEGDRSALENGRHEGDNIYGIGRFPAVKVERVVADGENISVGDIVVTATHTPGHTKGCTTWSIESPDDGALRRVVFPCSMTVAGNILVGNKSYPGIVEDYRRTFDRIGAMTADIVLPAHPEFVDLFKRKAKRDAGDTEAFVDRDLLTELVEKSRAAFEKQLKKEQARQ
jgi:metallo-beta-lactamase class B